MGRSVILAILSFTLVFSGGMIPTFITVKNLGLIDSYLALILPGSISTWNLIVVKNFFEGLPVELEEAAKIDGASDGTILAKIMLPLSKPALSTLTFFTFVATWNDYLGPLIYLKSQEKKTIQLGLKMFISQYSSDYGLIMAGSVLSLIPVLAVFLILQKYFVEGVASTGLKG